MKTVVVLIALASPCLADFPRFETREIDPHAGNVVYAVTVADVDGDGRPDVVALTEDAVLWYRNPEWDRREILKGRTERDNVCIQPHDIDGDGQIDFALGAGWRPPDTTRPGTLQWIGRDAKGDWQVHPIRFDEPSLHRIRFGKVLGDGKMQLVVAPLQGRGTKGPDWSDGPGAKVLVYSIPDDPSRPDWPVRVLREDRHTIHNLQLIDWDGDGLDDILLASREAVEVLKSFPGGKWADSQFAIGATVPSFKGASEIKVGRLRDKLKYVATIEPFHGSQVVAYVFQGNGKVFLREVLAEPVAWGHALWCADLDGDGEDELIVGQRDPNKDAKPVGPGVFVFDPNSAAVPTTFARHTVDDGGMACEDALAADLDGDGRPEIIAGGRATHNVKIYWNKGEGGSR